MTEDIDLATAFEAAAGDEAIVVAVIGAPGMSITIPQGVPAGTILPWSVIRRHLYHSAGLPVYAWTPTRVLWSTRTGTVGSVPRNPTDTPFASHG